MTENRLTTCCQIIFVVVMLVLALFLAPPYLYDRFGDQDTVTGENYQRPPRHRR